MSILSTIADRITRRKEERAATIAERRRRIVDSIAADIEPDESVDEFLDASGCTLADLEAEVSRVLRRRELLSKLGDEGELKEAIQLEQRQLEKADAAFKAAERAWHDTREDYARATQKLNLRLKEIGEAKVELRRMAPAEVAERFGRAQARVSELQEQLNGERRLAGNGPEGIPVAIRQAEANQENCASSGAQIAAQHHELNVRALRNRLAATGPVIARIEAELAEAQTEFDTAEAAILESEEV